MARFFRSVSGELLRVRRSPGTAGRCRWHSTPISATPSPNTTNSARQPNFSPTRVITGKPMLMPRVLPAMITVMTRPCRPGGTRRVP